MAILEGLLNLDGAVAAGEFAADDKGVFIETAKADFNKVYGVLVGGA